MTEFDLGNAFIEAGMSRLDEMSYDQIWLDDLLAEKREREKCTCTHDTICPCFGTGAPVKT